MFTLFRKNAQLKTTQILRACVFLLISSDIAAGVSRVTQKSYRGFVPSYDQKTM